MKKTKLPSLVSILILTLITVVVWVTFDVYRLFNKTAELVVPESVANPLNPTLDQNAIDQVMSRPFLNESEDIVPIENQNTEILTPVEEIIPTEEPSATEVSNPDTSDIPDATASGQ